MSVRNNFVLFCGGLLLVSAQLASAQMPLLGACPAVTVKSPFDPARYVGLWYEIEKYFFVFELGGKCVTAEYGALPNNQISVKNKQINSMGTSSEIEGVATLLNPSEAKLEVRFPSVPFNSGSPYWVLDTDYDNFAVVWSCRDYGLFHLASTWILTRERVPSAATMTNAYATLDQNNINKQLLLKTDQTNC